MPETVISEGAGQLLSQGLLGIIVVFLLWFHDRETKALKAELKTERERGNALQETRLAETKELVGVVNTNRTAMESMAAAVRGREAA